MRPATAMMAYNASSSQVPNGRYVGVDRPIEGKLQFRKRTVMYEYV